ncbi:cellulase family glycosylhydrolase [Fluviicola taffensis]|uniref:Glycoside hydrolase family 5 n=1 Tax=Fluviicola taffensis (strain DSM 16823 / NCIMB 13979 / RW262) TaxID=755732 RepID=F2IIQ4_FLUTR|nr:cellulase family glycosylhydrolase [Fluviicola taffensis]AEA46016.1 glycoside hydrolase family 5 [Fluviicola taffensis DSM 16823]
MRKQFYAGFLVVFFGTYYAIGQQNTLQVVGKNLTSINGQNIILRGVNYGLINQGDISLADAAGYQSYIDEVANTGANAVRIPWYTSGQNWRDIPGPPNNGTPGTVDGYVTNGHLSNIIAYCISKKMIPILSIHDDSYITCKDNWAYFNSTVMDFWTDPDVLTLIEANKAYLIINLANEFDKVRWGAGSLATELNTFKSNYSAAVATLRQAGVNVPIIIDAPDCGQSSTELLSIAVDMNQNDTRHNLIFSSHAYWYGYASTLAQVQTKLNEAQNTNVCFILGEVATNQDGDNGECGLNDLSTLYPIILDEVCSRNIGWLAWTFSLDCSSAREMSPTGSASNLTTFGNDIINNPNYGLKSTNGCGAVVIDESVGIDSKTSQVFSIEPNPASTNIAIHSAFSNCSLSIRNALGELVLTEKHTKNSNVRIADFNPGIYFVELENSQQTHIQKLIIY